MCTIRNDTMRAVRVNTIQVNTASTGGTKQVKLDYAQTGSTS